LEINNWFDLSIYFTFTIAMVIAIPIGLRYFYFGTKSIVQLGWRKKSLKLLSLGLFFFFVGIWYLFFDKGGHIFLLYQEVKDFLFQFTSFKITFKTIMSISFSILFFSFISSIFFIKSDVKEKDGFYVLRYNFMFKIFSYFMIIIAILLFKLILEKEDGIIILSVSFIILFLSAIMVFLQFNLVKIKYDNTNIYLYTPWRKNRIIQWSSLKTYTLLESRHIYRFTTHNKDIVNIPFSLSGLGGFFERFSEENVNDFH
jgi:hypothetical protein